MAPPSSSGMLAPPASTAPARGGAAGSPSAAGSTSGAAGSPGAAGSSYNYNYYGGSSASATGHPAAATAGRPVYSAVSSTPATAGSLGRPTGILDERAPQPVDGASAGVPVTGQKPIIRTILPRGSGEGTEPVPELTDLPKAP
jgi:hypothetical protein